MTISTANAFRYGLTESIGQTAITYTLTAARYTVLTYDFLTSPEAKATYKWVGSMTVALSQLAFWSAVWAYAKTQEWVDSEVASALPTGEMVDADPFSPDENQHYAAVALVVPTALAYQAMTTAQLRKACQEAGIKWRNAYAKGKHLSKGEMIEALS